MNEMQNVPTSNGHDVLNIARILVPTDFSEHADHALRYAVGLARKTQAHLEVLHVNTVYKPELFGSIEDPEFAEDVRECLEEKTLERLHALCERMHVPAGTTTVALTDASPVLMIVEQAQSSRADLIVMGTHGRHGLGRMLLGSVAEEVVDRARTSSVLVVGDEADVGQVRRILAPTDLSASAQRTVHAARDLAFRLGAELHVLHVVEPVPLPASLTSGTKGLYDYVPEVSGAIEKEMGQLFGHAAGDGGPAVVQHVEKGHAARSIVDFIESHDIDLVMMASQGGSLTPPFFVGSVTERVVRSATCPVLVMR